MPLYEFRCETCGPFEQWRKLSEASSSIICPTCQAGAKQVYSAPGVILTPYALRRRVEQSAVPKVATRHQTQEPGPDHHAHEHKSQGHSHVHSGRPWMVGH